MIIKFKDGKEIEFKRHGRIWLAENVIWDYTKIHCSFDELRELKAKIAKWFDETAPEEIREKYNARLPLWRDEIENLPFKDQIAYKERETNQIAIYLLGDEDGLRPVLCNVCYSSYSYGWLWCDANIAWDNAFAVRLCLEEKE